MKQICHSAAMVAIILFVSLAGVAHAEDGAWQVGVKGNVNGSQLRGDQIGFWLSEAGWDVSGTVGDSRLGFGAGAYARWQGSGIVGLQAELWYVEKGGQGTVFGTAEITDPNSVISQGDVSGTATVHLSYTELPVMAVFVFPADDDGKVTLTGQVGGYLAYNTRARAQLEGKITGQLADNSLRSFDFDETRSITNSVKPWDVGGILGMGLEVRTGKVLLVFDTRFSFGFGSIDNTSNDRSVRNQTFAFNFGVGFPL